MPIEPTKIAGLLNFRFAAGSMAKWGSVSCHERTVTVTIQFDLRHDALKKKSSVAFLRGECEMRQV